MYFVNRRLFYHFRSQIIIISFSNIPTQASPMTWNPVSHCKVDAVVDANVVEGGVVDSSDVVEGGVVFSSDVVSNEVGVVVSPGGSSVQCKLQRVVS